MLGLTRSCLSFCNKSISVVGGSKIKCIGSIQVNITYDQYSTQQILYFCQSVTRFFLSCQACKELNIIPASFPFPPAPPPPSLPTTAAINSTNDIPRTSPPPKPTSLPYPPTPDNIPLLKQYLLNAFASSAFNITQPFPKLLTPPGHIHLKPNAVPHACHTPSVVAYHWENEVKALIDRDVAAGILIPVPIGEASEWCARMVVVPKKNNSPRRTVDYQKLNSQCLRETHHCRSPFQTACRIPPNTKKTVLDAVDGYHSVALDDSSSRLTTFITPWGRYRYLRYPQGHRSAGDAYNSRIYKILQHIQRMERIVDDTCIYDDNIESSFYHTWQLLETCALNGVVVNSDKFQFCCDSVNFAGLTIGPNGVQPSSNMLGAIEKFPPPTDLTSARAWFGLVNQVQWAYANGPAMAPFRELVRPKSKFYWDKNLDNIFKKAKQRIITQVQEGVRAFNIERHTCVQTDWSNKGIGYLLLQKYCECDLDQAPLCCHSGWHLVFAGSRFTNSAESRYAPTEGEALAVSWALQHSRVFTLGCPKLMVSTDHRPLLGIFNDRHLDDIRNPRICRLKEKTLF